MKKICNSHWEFICLNKCHPGTSEISIPPEIAVGTHFHTWHGTKTIAVFLPADEEASWSLLPSSVSLVSGGRVQPENAYSCILKVTSQVWESQHRISININYSYHHLPKPVSTDPTRKSDSVLTNLIGRDGVRGWSIE